MSSAHNPRRLTSVLIAAAASCVWAGCADPQLPDHRDLAEDSSDEGGQTAAFGGNDSVAGGRAASTGGTASFGGHTAQGSQTGGAALGGNSQSSGGALPVGSGGTRTGGSSATGGVATGGVASGGGNQSSGGFSNTGGISTTGGVSAAGGTVTTGGAYVTGGNTTGGLTSTGGASSMGGVASSGGATSNLLKSSGFEGSSTDGWVKRGTATIAVSAEQAHTGARSLKVTGRTSGWHGAEYDVLSLVEAGDSYTVSVWARPTPGSATSNLMLTRELQGCGATDYVWLATAANATDAAWVELRGTLAVPSTCSPTKLVIYVESSNATLSYYVDDTSMRKQ